MTINNKNYIAKDIDANFICALEGCDLTLADIGKLQNKMFSFLRAYLAFCADISAVEAGNQLSLHVINGGNYDAVSECFVKKIGDSAFFQAMFKRTEEETAESAEETPKKKTAKKE